MAQAECVAWSNGWPLDHRPITDDRNWHPSDGDEETPARAYQDYDLDELGVTCGLTQQETTERPYVGLPTDFGVVAGIYVETYDGFPIPPPPVVYGDYAVAVERGDCSPYDGHSFRWRATLDFVDPNGIYHEVQEYDYVCGSGARGGPGGNPVLDPSGLLFNATDQHAREQFPWNGVGVGDWDECDPLFRVEAGEGHHRCNGNAQDLVRERLWLTRTHAPVYESTWRDSYSFALQVDTCSGPNVFERPRDRSTVEQPVEEHLGSLPRDDDICSDGSSYSFDDTGRGMAEHTGPPADKQEIFHGNAYDYSWQSTGFGTHRTACRNDATDWRMNLGLRVGDDCYAEDHRAAGIDLYLSTVDPTGLFEMHRVDTAGAPGYLGIGPVEGPATETEPPPEPTPELPPHPPLITGHTVYAEFVGRTVSGPLDQQTVDLNATSGEDLYRLPAEGPPARVVQAECVTWFNGKNLDQRPAGDDFDWGFENAFPSDEDETRREGVPNGGGDHARQDYDMDRFVDTCVPLITNSTVDPWVGLPTDFAAVAGMVHGPTLEETETISGFVTVTERGDCEPVNGRDFRFRGHLDFVDANNIYHEVQEYDYVCAADQGVDGVKAAFPLTGTDPHNVAGCREHATPATTADPTAGDPGHFDFGHKCNGSIQDLFTERMWITPLHQAVQEPTALAPYNFALTVDTCAGTSIFEGPPLLEQGGGMPAEGEDDGFGDTWSAPRWTAPVTALDDLLAKAGLRAKGTDVCTDGSSFSFDDTVRDHVGHGAPPGDHMGKQAGNAFDFNSTSSTFGKHRQNCRSDFASWHSGLPRESGQMGEDCFEEHHRSAAVDLHHHATDPTGGLWSLYTNGMTGLNAYVEGESTGPRYYTPQR